MTIGNGGRPAEQTKYPPVLSLSRSALWQSGTGELVDRTMLLRSYGPFRRGPILSWVRLPLTRLREASPVSVVAPLIVDRFRDSSVVAGHGRQDRPDLRHRQALDAAALPARGLPGLLKPRRDEIRPAFAAPC